MVRKSILIVEDDPSIHQCLQELFQSEGYPVALAEHGQAALDFLEKSSTEKPGLILLDLMMPVMDGLTFLLELELKNPELFTRTPIFVMTARADTHQLTMKATGLLKKPFTDLDELSKVAARHCS